MNINMKKSALNKFLFRQNKMRAKKIEKRQEELRLELADLHNCTPARRIRINIELDSLRNEYDRVC
jgi:hypothetical protein